MALVHGNIVDNTLPVAVVAAVFGRDVRVFVVITQAMVDAGLMVLFCVPEMLPEVVHALLVAQMMLVRGLLENSLFPDALL